MKPRLAEGTSAARLAAIRAAIPAAIMAAGLASPAAGCDLALVLAVDVSGSVDYQEYRTQMQGLAAGLRDPEVADALVRGRAAVALVQWSGSSRQELSIGFSQMRGQADIDALARTVETTPRAWPFFSTAIGEALLFSADAFAAAPECRRRVIDISSDGRSNEGVAPAEVLPRLQAAAIGVNALVIQDKDEGLPAYFYQNVILGSGAFVVTAENYRQFPDRMQRKLRRETEVQISSDPLGELPVGHGDGG